MIALRLALALCSAPAVARATFSPSFRAFLNDTYGDAAERELSREDVFPPGAGSFGGGEQHTAGERTARRPVIIVHGLNTIASEYQMNRQYFLDHGYSDEEIYATTYGRHEGGDSMVCRNVKAIRLLILAVHAFTGNSSVDVVAYSMGPPLTRKAILGGRCVDTDEDLGEPLTPIIHTFVGACGANFGAEFLCPSAPYFNPACNTVTGMACESRFLSDINDEEHYRNGSYEGSLVYTIYSKIDEVVGYRVCDEQRLVSSIPHETRAHENDLFEHAGIIYLTLDLQLQLVLADQGVTRDDHRKNSVE